jgi:hypothetical protein
MREVQRGQGVWQGQSLWEPDPASDDPDPPDALRTRGRRTLQHVFTLLGLTMPPAPLMMAYQGLSSRDGGMRGTSLEYLETVLPAPVLAALAPLLEGGRRPAAPSRPPAQVLEDLLRSGASMQIDTAALHRAFEAAGAAVEPPSPPAVPPAGEGAAQLRGAPPPQPPETL